MAEERRIQNENSDAERGWRYFRIFKTEIRDHYAPFGDYMLIGKSLPLYGNYIWKDGLWHRDTDGIIQTLLERRDSLPQRLPRVYRKTDIPGGIEEVSEEEALHDIGMYYDMPDKYLVSGDNAYNLTEDDMNKIISLKSARWFNDIINSVNSSTPPEKLHARYGQGPVEQYYYDNLLSDKRKMEADMMAKYGRIICPVIFELRELD